MLVRCVALDAGLKPVAAKAVSLTVQNPAQVKLMVLQNTTGAHGVASFQVAARALEIPRAEGASALGA